MTSPPAFDGACRLDDLGVIRARGVDAATFLQGQLTNDVVGLDDSRARLAAFCSSKGRMQASFIVWRNGAEEFALACSRDLLAPTLKRLAMFVLRAKCKLDDASGDIMLWGLAGHAAAAPGGADRWQREQSTDSTGSTIRLPDSEGRSRALHIGIGDPAPPAAGSLSLADWRWLDVSSGIVTIVAATVDRFVPQMVNFEHVGGVDFQKGCYPGQEVVARSQYRGTLKRRAFLFDVDARDAAAGDDVYAEGQPAEPVGTVANAAPSPSGGGSRALVELRLAALDAPLRLRAGDGPPLVKRPMPYDLPLPADADA